MNESSQGMHGTDLSCAQDTKQVMSNLTEAEQVTSTGQ